MTKIVLEPFGHGCVTFRKEASQALTADLVTFAFFATPLTQWVVDEALEGAALAVVAATATGMTLARARMPITSLRHTILERTPNRCRRPLVTSRHPFLRTERALGLLSRLFIPRKGGELPTHDELSSEP
jgi:hypothetical protein